MIKSFKWQLIIILVAGLIIGILLLSEQTGFRLVSPVPARGGIYTEGIVGRLQRLNPVLDYYNQADRDVNRLVFSSLIKFDASGKPISDLAENWGVSFDGLYYNFEIRENAYWHDGTPVTAEDVLFTIELMRDADSVLPEDIKEFWSQIEVHVLSEKALQFKLNEPFAPFINYLSFNILPQHLLGGMTYNQIINSEFNINPIGSGPYHFDRLIIEENQIRGVSLMANANYYGKVPFIQEFIFRYYPDVESAFNAYLQGDINGIGELNEAVIIDALRNPTLSVYSMVKPEIAMVLLNLDNDSLPFFQDKDVRRALLMGIDRRGMIDSILNGQGVIADVPLLPNSWAYYNGNERIDHNTETAQDILDNAGYEVETESDGIRRKDGIALSFTLTHPQDDYHTRIAQSIQSDWAKLGVKVQLEGVPYDSLILDHLQPLIYQAALVDINYYRFPDPDPYPFWDRTQIGDGQNYSQWNNDVVSQYLEEARVTSDLDKRAKLYRNFQVIFIEEMPALPLFYPIYSFAVDDAIQGIRIGPMFDASDRFWNVGEWFLLAETSPGRPRE